MMSDLGAIVFLIIVFGIGQLSTRSPRTIARLLSAHVNIQNEQLLDPTTQKCVELIRDPTNEAWEDHCPHLAFIIRSTGYLAYVIFVAGILILVLRQFD